MCQTDLQSYAKVDSNEEVCKKLMRVQVYVMVSWLQALLFMTDHHWWEEPRDTTVLLLPMQTRISKNTGSLLQYLQCIEALHARSNSSFSRQIHQQRSLEEIMTLTCAYVS